MQNVICAMQQFAEKLLFKECFDSRSVLVDKATNGMDWSMVNHKLLAMFTCTQL